MNPRHPFSRPFEAMPINPNLQRDMKKEALLKAFALSKATKCGALACALAAKTSGLLFKDPRKAHNAGVTLLKESQRYALKASHVRALESGLRLFTT